VNSERRGRTVSCYRQLLQLRVLCFRLLQGGDVGVGVFPEAQLGSLRQTDMAQQDLKARVGAEIVNPQISFDEIRDVRGSSNCNAFRQPEFNVK